MASAIPNPMPRAPPVINAVFDTIRMPVAFLYRLSAIISRLG
jgi:hypothetical protein